MEVNDSFHLRLEHIPFMDDRMSVVSASLTRMWMWRMDCIMLFVYLYTCQYHRR